MISVLQWLYYTLVWSELKWSKHSRQWDSEDRWWLALMRGFYHWAGWEPEPNVDCGVLEFDKTDRCLSDSQLTALYLRLDHNQTPSSSMSFFLFFFLNAFGVFLFSPLPFRQMYMFRLLYKVLKGSSLPYFILRSVLDYFFLSLYLTLPLPYI